MSNSESPLKASTVGAVMIAAIGVGMWFGRPAPSQPSAAPSQVAVEQAAPAAHEAVEEITVHVAGAVARPGLVELAAGARVADAIAAGGGALHTADLTGINLAGEVADGHQVVVPTLGDGTRVADAEPGKIRLNTADAAELETLPGVGPVLAASIVSHRDDHGPFSSVEDLLSVPGIGEAKLASLRDRVVVP